MISSLRRSAQAIRHAPGLRSLGPLWTTLRGPYLRVLRAAGSRHGIEVTVGETRMRLHPEFATQNWETVEGASYRAFASMLRPGDVVFDIGAHIGTYALTALDRIGPAGRVVAFEPHGFTAGHLARHIEWAGGMNRTLIRQLCCGSEPGRAAFYCVSGKAEGMNGLVPVQGFDRVDVEVTTVDREVDRLAIVPTVIKIDVEGTEWDVLKGANRTLSDHQPRLSLSLHPAVLHRAGVSSEDILSWLANRGYACRIVSEDHEVHVIAEARAATSAA